MNIFKIVYLGLMRDKLLVPMIMVAWGLQIYLVSKLNLLSDVLLVLLMLTAYYVGIRTNRVFANMVVN